MKASVACLLLPNLLTTVFLRGNEGSLVYRRTKDSEINGGEVELIRENCKKYFTDRKGNTGEEEGNREVVHFLKETIDKNADVRRSYGAPSIACDFETSSYCGYEITSEGSDSARWEWTNKKPLQMWNMMGNIVDERRKKGHFLLATIPDLNGVIRVKSTTERLAEIKCMRFSFIGNGLLTVKLDMIGGSEQSFVENIKPFIWQSGQVDIPVGEASVEFELESPVSGNDTISGIDNIELLDGPCISNTINCPGSLFPCLDNSRCIHSSQLCDGVYHCHDESDESERCCPGRKPNYNVVVVTEDTLLVTDIDARNLQLYSRHDGKLQYTSHELESIPMDVCLISKTEVAVCLADSKLVILSFKSVDDVKRVKTLDVETGFIGCHSVAKLNSDKLVVSGVEYDMMLCWGVVSITDGRLHSTHNICKGYRSHLANKDNTVYISCRTYDSTTDGVYAYDMFNPHTHKFLYQHKELEHPGRIMADRDCVYVIDSNRIHQLTDSGQLVTIHTVSSSLHGIFYDDQHGVLYTTHGYGSNMITVYRMEYSNQTGVPVEILSMDDRSIQLFEDALKDGKETIYSIRLMVVGHIGAGKTTLVKRLLGEEVNIYERRSTEGIDVYVNCCDVSLSTCQWTRREKDSEQDYNLQRFIKVLNQNYQTRDSATDQEQVASSPQKEISDHSQNSTGADHDTNTEVLYSRSPQQNIGQNISSTAGLQEDSFYCRS